MPDPTPTPTPTPMPHPHPFPDRRIVYPIIYTNNCQPTLCQAQVAANKNKLISDLAYGNVSSNSDSVAKRAQDIQDQESACNSFTSNRIITY